MQEIIQSHWFEPEEVEIIYPKTNNNRTTTSGDGTVEYLDYYNEVNLSSNRMRFEVKEKIARPLAHEFGILHSGAQVWVYDNNGNVILQRRAANVSSSPGLLDSAASGHVTTWERISEAWVRELQQEVGIFANENKLELLGNYRKETKKLGKDGKIIHNNEIDQIFALPYNWNISDLIIWADEVAELLLVPINTLEKEWNSEIEAKKYTIRSREYKRQVINKLKKIMWL